MADIEPELVPADKRLRAKTLAAAVLVIFAGLLLLGILRSHLQGLRRSTDDEREALLSRAARLTTVSAWIGGASFVGVGAWLLLLGRRINRAGRYPPPGMKVVRDTRVRTGGQARTMANLVEVFGFVSILIGTAGMWHLYGLAMSLLRTR